MEKAKPSIGAGVLDFHIPREMVKLFEEDLRFVLKDYNPKGILLLSSKMLGNPEALKAVQANFDIVAVPKTR